MIVLLMLTIFVLMFTMPLSIFYFMYCYGMVKTWLMYNILIYIINCCIVFYIYKYYLHLFALAPILGLFGAIFGEYCKKTRLTICKSNFITFRVTKNHYLFFGIEYSSIFDNIIINNKTFRKVKFNIYMETTNV